MAVDKKELLEYIPQKERDSIPLEDFAWPEERKYPCDTQDHVDSCAKLLGHAPADKQASIKARAIRIAHRHGFSIPDSWKSDGQQEESAATVASSTVKPKKKIATLKVCFLEYNARSLNGRIYPKSTCDKIYASMQRKLADSNSLPMTCFVSHEAANGNANTELVGRVVGGSQEGNKFYALIDLADTSVSRDQLALVEGGYMQSESMRVLGVELLHDRNYDLPLVVPQEGVEPELMGIDLTTRPGLQDTARILQTLYESAPGQEHYTETFTLDTVSIETQEAKSVGIPLYLKVIAEALELKEAMTADRAAHGRIHDHLAGVLDATIAAKHGEESARYIALAEAELSEEGKAIAKKHAVRLAAAHDESARQMGMDCEGAYNEALGIDDQEPINKGLNDDPDGDGIPDKLDPADHDESAQDNKGEKELTEQEMLEALKAKGFAITPPKTAEEELAELKAQLVEQAQQLKALQEGQQTPQRKTQVASGFDEQSDLKAEELYEDGDYLKGTLAPKNWRALANPRTPWPENLDPNLVLHELAPFMEHKILGVQYAAQGQSLSDAIHAGMLD